MPAPLPSLHCERCGWTWHPRANARPGHCPKCDSPYWDIPKKPALQIENDGPRILSGDFWDSDMARRGFFFMSVNAGAARLLVPDCRADQVPDMSTAKLVVISRGPGMGRRDMFELLFDDDSEEPYALHFGVQQIDRLIPARENGQELAFTAWGRNAVLLFERPARFRLVDSVPCLEAWQEVRK
jgi:hypothetical protein